MDNSVNYSTILKTKYGDNFFVNYLRNRGAPLNVRNTNQLSGLLGELLNFLRRQNDNSNNNVISYIDNLSYLRNAHDLTETTTLMQHLGLNVQIPVQTISQMPTMIPQQLENIENTEKVTYLRGIPNEECPICLEKIEIKGYATEKCRHFFHKKCLETHCLNKQQCVCPICRRTFQFINKRGGKKRTRKFKKIKRLMSRKKHKMSNKKTVRKQ